MKRLLYLTAVTLVCAFTFNIVLCSNVKAASFSGTAVVEESIKHNITDDFEIDEYGVLKKYTGSDSHVIIPEGVVSIGIWPFFGCGDFFNASNNSGQCYFYRRQCLLGMWKFNQYNNTQ